jgi:hypothetical protein
VYFVKRVFGSVVVVAFQIAFRAEIHANDVFSFFKNYFWHQHIKTIQKVQTALNFSKKKKLKFSEKQVQPQNQTAKLSTPKSWGSLSQALCFRNPIFLGIGNVRDFFLCEEKTKKKTTTFKPGPGLTQRIHKFYVAAKNLTVPESGEFFLCNFSLYAIAGLIFFYM